MLLELLEHARLWLENQFSKSWLIAKIFIPFCIADLGGLLICNIWGLRFYADPSTAGLAPFWPLKTVLFFLGPLTILLTWIGVGIADIAQEILPTSWKEEIETSAAVKVAMHLIGIDAFALAAAYWLDPRSAPGAYTLIVVGIVICIYRMSKFPKTIFRRTT